MFLKLVPTLLFVLQFQISINVSLRIVFVAKYGISGAEIKLGLRSMVGSAREKLLHFCLSLQNMKALRNLRVQTILNTIEIRSICFLVNRNFKHVSSQMRLLEGIRHFETCVNLYTKSYNNIPLLELSFTSQHSSVYCL